MQFTRFLFIVIFLTACSSVSQPIIKTGEYTRPWEKKIFSRQKHTYNKLGLLDTTYRVEEYFVKGILASTTDFVIIRKYNNKNNLLREKAFQLLEKKSILSEETQFEYDTGNNLILRTNIFQNVTAEIVRFIYNDFHQKIQETRIQKRPDLNPENWTITSVIGHQKDKQLHVYDTSTIQYVYNENGKIVKEIHLKDDRKIEVSSQQDTGLITKYQDDRNIVTKIRNHKKLIDTTIYDHGLKIYSVSIYKKFETRHKETFKYDEKGNEIEYSKYN